MAILQLLTLRREQDSFRRRVLLLTVLTFIALC